MENLMENSTLPPIFILNQTPDDFTNPRPAHATDQAPTWSNITTLSNFKFNQN